MGDVSISYGNGFCNGLLDAKKTAGKVADKLEDYENNLRREVYNKLDNYHGDMTGNITSALNSIKAKRTQLSSDAEKYDQYATDLKGLKEQCEIVDHQVAKRVNSLAADFKNAYAIETNVVIDAINNLLTSAKNKFSCLRTASEILNTAGLVAENFLERIKNIYEYKGGKEYLTGMAAGVLNIGIAIAGLVAICATGGLLISIIAAIGTGIAIADSLIDIANEHRAFAANLIDNDPARARRLHDENTASETIMGEATSNIAFAETTAGAIDGVRQVCDGIVALYSIGKMGKAFLTWGGGKGGLGIRLKAVGQKSVDNVKKLVVTAKKSGFKEFVTNAGKYVWSDLKMNIGSNYFYKYDSYLDAGKNTKYTANCVKNWMSISKDLITGDFEIGDWALNNFTAFRYNLDKEGNVHEWKTLGDVVDLKGKFEKGVINIGKLFMSEHSSVNITVPDLHIPDIHVSDMKMPDIKIPSIVF